MFNAGSLVYNVIANTQGAITGFARVTNSANAMNTGISRVSRSVSKALNFAGPLGKAAAAAAASAAAITAFSISVANAEKELEILARLAKVSARDFRALEFAMESIGISGEKFSDMSKDVSDRLGEYISAETGVFVDFIDVMRMSAAEGIKWANTFAEMTPIDAMREMVSMMQKAGKTTEQMTFALESLSNDATRLLPLLMDGGKLYDEMIAKYKDATKAFELSKGQKKDLVILNENYRILTASIEAAGRALGANLAPVANEFVNSMISALPDLIARFDEVARTIMAIFDEDGLAVASAETLLRPWLNFAQEMYALIGRVGETLGTFLSDFYDNNKIMLDGIFDAAKETVFAVGVQFLNLPNVIKAAFESIVIQLTASISWVKKFIETVDLSTLWNSDDFRVDFDAFGRSMREAVEAAAPYQEAANEMHKENLDQLKAQTTEIENNIAKVITLANNLDEAAKKKKNLFAGGATTEVVITESRETAPKRRPETAKEKVEREKVIDISKVIKLRERMDTETPSERVTREEAEALFALQTAFKNTMAAREAHGRSVAELEAARAADMKLIEAAGQLERTEEINGHYAAIIEGLQAHEDAKTAIVEEAARKRTQAQQEEFEAAIQAYSDLAGGVSESFGAIASAMEKSEGEQSGLYKAMFALSKGFAIAQAGLNFGLALSQALSDPTAITLPQKIANYAVVASQFGALITSISGASYGGGRKMGGPISDGNYYNVNETGVPEVYSAGGKDYLMATRNASITPLNKFGGGGGGNVTINNMAGVQVNQTQTDDGWIFELVRRESERAGEQAYNRVARDFSRNSGSVFSAARGNTDIKGKPGRR